MKCPLCDGKGEYIRSWGGYMPCGYCNGTGEIEQTNEEWFCSLRTEEKAKALENIIRSVLVQRPPMCHDVCNSEFWETWLKQPHREE